MREAHWGGPGGAVGAGKSRGGGEGQGTNAGMDETWRRH